MREFTRMEMASIKRTAANVKTFKSKVARIEVRIADLEQEKADLNETIDLYEAPIKFLSGGFTSTDILSAVENNVDITTGEIKDVNFEEPTNGCNCGTEECACEEQPFLADVTPVDEFLVDPFGFEEEPLVEAPSEN